MATPRGILSFASSCRLDFEVRLHGQLNPLPVTYQPGFNALPLHSIDTLGAFPPNHQP